MKDTLKVAIFVLFTIIGILLALAPDETLKLILNAALRFSIAIGVTAFGGWIAFHEKK